MDAPGAEMGSITVSPGPARGTISITSAPLVETPSQGNLLIAERTTHARAVAGQVRHIPIGWDADIANARPSLHNGVLRIAIPRVKESAAPRETGRQAHQP